VIEKSGSWYSYGDERIGQGRENAKNFPQGQPGRRAEIEDKIRNANGLDFSVAPTAEDLME
jgi:recombination protein RecA